MNVKNRFALGLVLILFSVLIFISRADSFGATFECAPRTPCQMYVGEERTYPILLQSGQGEGDVRVKVELLDDAGGLAQIVGDNEFDVPAGSNNVNAYIRVRIGENQNIGGTVNLVIKVSEVAGQEDGQVGLSPSFTMNFPLNIVEKAPSVQTETKDSSGGVMGVFALAIGLVLVVLVAITFVLIRNKDRNLN